MDTSKLNALAVSALYLGATYSDKDGCVITRVICSRCRKEYDEEFGHATALVMCGAPFVCIRCEGGTADVSCGRITIGGLLVAVG